MAEDQSHILVVDDQELNRDLLSRRLRKAGYQVSCAVDGFDALEQIAAQTFDLVLLDIMMPGMNGLEVLEHVRRTHSVTDLPVIMATAKTDNETVVEALQLGANDYVTKPLEFGVVLARVRSHLLVREASRGTSAADVRAQEDPETLAARRYCDRCRSSVQEDAGSCSFCNQPRPTDGWPRVVDSTFTYLGRTVGSRYFLDRCIGGGAVGAVYHARDLELNREYAAKIISLEDPDVQVNRDELRERTAREVNVLSKLTNPHIVKIYDVVTINDNVFALILDYVRGFSLSRLLERAPRLSVVKALDIARQVAQGLYEAHQRGIVHCDIKPDNIMIEKLPIRGHFVHILDFGIAEILDFQPRNQTYHGTPHYSAPEQFRDPDAIDHRTDIYALGAVLFHMIEGHPPFEGNNVYEVLTRHFSEPVPRLKALEPYGTERQFIEELLQRMLAKEPAQRFQDLSGFLRYVDAIMPMFQGRDLERAQKKA